MRRVEVAFRAVHYYRSLGGTEGCPHTHTYTVEVACTECDEVEEVLKRVKGEVEGRLLNDWDGLLYPEPTTENLAVSIYALLPKGKVGWVSVREDDTVKAIYDGRDVWVTLFKADGRRTCAAGVKGRMDGRGFAADLKEVEGNCRV